MCDSPVLRPQAHLFPESSHSGVNSEESREDMNIKSILYRFQLEQDVQKLKQKLQEEIELHDYLERAMEKEPSEASLPTSVPYAAHEAVSHIVTMEASVAELELQMESLQLQLSQERSERRLAEYHLMHSSALPDCSSNSELHQSLHMDLTIHNSESTSQCCSPAESTAKLKVQSESGGKWVEGMSPKRLWEQPNVLSEEMVRCMKNIFISLSEPSMNESSRDISPVSPRDHLSNSSWWPSTEGSMISTWMRSPQIDVQNEANILATTNVFDPYRVSGKLSWVDIGNYGFATEVARMSVGKKQLDYASGALRRFRTLVEQLARVNPNHLSCDERLAFWINLYNALIMHAYLAYGVPKSDLKLFSLMQKAAYTVGGHLYSAATIEYVILKMKPPLHRPQIGLLLAIHKVRVSEEQRRAAIDAHQPLLAFALSCGMYSSPAVRIYTAQGVKEELVEAQRDFTRAAVGLSSQGKVLIPKMLHCFSKSSFVDDSSLVAWISRHLPPHQAAFVEHCLSRSRQGSSLNASLNFGILPFDSRFRYLFLPDKISV